MIHGELARNRAGLLGMLVTFLLLILMAPVQSYGQTVRSADLLQQLSDSFENVVRKVSPAVVQIMVTGYGPVGGESQNDAALIGRQQVTGSGVIIDPNGYVVTNAHVVSGAQRVRVMLTSPQATGSPISVMRSRSRILNAKIVGVDKEVDLALLKIDASRLPTLKLADYRRARQGEIVLAFGSPEGLENSVTMGVISSVARQPLPDRPMIYIQTDAPINPGNSGGPLVDVDGELVGINTFILSEGGGNEGLGFAIPSAVVKHVYEQLKQFGHVHRKVVGVVIQPITSELAAALNLAQDHGIMVADVMPGGPAQAAGLQIEDIVLAVDGKAMESLPQFEAFLFLRAKGDKLKIDILRGKERLTLEVPVVEQRDEVDRLADLADPEKNLISKLGIVGVPIDDKIAQVLTDLRIPSGVIVAALTDSVAARESGLAAGDVIHAVNNTPISTLESLRKALDQKKPGDPLALQIERDGQLQFVVVDTD
jgi:serine protease Do